MADIPAAAASTGILYLEYLPPGASFVYSTPKSFSKSKIPKTIAVTRFPNDAIVYEFTTPSADSMEE